ncbi:mitochondrial carrier [Dentipellis sp. KUC8613]|nr:mitochondrial carrier [Dentipellis sp. KUC8613]
MTSPSPSSASASEQPRASSSTSTSPSTAPAAIAQSASASAWASVFSPQVTTYFIAGGVAGAASRTVVSPLERLKIIQQVQPAGEGAADRQYKGVWRSLVRMWREEGFQGYMRGNGINCVRIIPYSAVQFTTYEQLKKWFTRGGTRELDTPTRLLSGALAGITSVCSTYPLDLVRSRLSIATSSILTAPPLATPPARGSPAFASAYHTSATAVRGRADMTMWGMTLKVFREEGGVRALYRGLVTTAMGVAPYVGINFAAYEALRGVLTPPGKTSVTRKLACGALAGSISQTLTYPFDVVRRKMQVVGMKSGDLGPKYSGAIDAVRVIIRNEGLRGMYRGLWPNLLKVAPSIATSFFTYELVKEFLLGVP